MADDMITHTHTHTYIYETVKKLIELTNSKVAKHKINTKIGSISIH